MAEIGRLRNLSQQPVLPMHSENSNSLSRKRLAIAAFWVWLLAWVTPSLGGAPGWQLAVFALFEGWQEPTLGPWAVLANLTFPWAVMYVLNGRSSKRLLMWTAALLVTSPAYWLLIQSPSADSFGVFLWTASFVILGIADARAVPIKPETAARKDSPALEEAGV
jgi:hypothetical protein